MKLENIKKKTTAQLKNLGKKSEATIQKEIVNFCKLNKILIFCVPNEATRSNSKFIGMGVLPGVSDLVLILQNKVIFIELKNHKGIQSEKQKEFESRVLELGHHYIIIRSLEEFKKLIAKVLFI
jgi:hypothetical protein